MATIFLGLGSNLGNRNKNIHHALAALKQADIKIVQLSSIIETEPVDGPGQDKFLNAVLKAETALSPEDLLIEIKMIEKNLGRTSSVRNGPRVIDIDILLYDDIKISTVYLEIPHPRMLERDFVMDPLREIAPTLFEELCDANT
ncbi:MAG: 2-amino-4-hydroxy-6-hydroxymethyldihydropteridine diphosphokinase [Candidatus Omnitrophica bacterium]|nr:2-amino-4-hydroxy-6-hydroxymethyldihydropteridine diphosphokinase [Candidatus Omnitrophota bacterium]